MQYISYQPDTISHYARFAKYRHIIFFDVPIMKLEFDKNLKRVCKEIHNIGNKNYIFSSSSSNFVFIKIKLSSIKHQQLVENFLFCFLLSFHVML